MEYKMIKTPRSLGKDSSFLLSTLSSQGKTIFTRLEAEEILRKNPATTRRLLNRLKDKKWLIKLATGKYLIVPLSAGEKAEFTEDWFIIGKHLTELTSYYFSHYSALDLHQMTTQPLVTVYITTPKRHKPIEILGATYRFIYAKPEKLWGIEDIWAKPTEKVKVSDLERTIIDCLCNPKLCGGISELSKGLWSKRNEIDFSRLLGYVKRFGSKAVAKRLGFLLEVFELDNQDITANLQKMTSSSFVLLDPSLPTCGKHLSRWRIRININPEELKEITKT
jgi:predicted transcriptional regulator of viral defense system